MKLQFRSNDREEQRWPQRAANRLRQALGRLHGLVARMKVRLDDVNGPAGGVDKRSKVEVLVQGGGPVAISATARTWQVSVEAMASRLRQRVAPQLHRATPMARQTTGLVPVRARAGAPIAGVRPPQPMRHA